MGLNQAQNEVSRHFLDFESLVYLEIAYDDSLQQCLTSSRGKPPYPHPHPPPPPQKNWGPRFGSDEPKLGPKLCFFFSFSQVWFISFP